MAAYRRNGPANDRQPQEPHAAKHIAGILPLVHIKHVLFGNELVSMPYLDTGGVIADDQDVHHALAQEAARFAAANGIPKIELRQPDEGGLDQNPQSETGELPANTSRHTLEGFEAQPLRHKVRMILELPDSPEALMQSFKSKRRSQIRKPMRDGLTVHIGSEELLDAFYTIFCVNMRDLGSPVHSKVFFREMLRSLNGQMHILLIRRQDTTPLAASIVIGFGNCLYNPWASSLKAYKKLNANMLLYWHMLEFACQRHYTHFDFGRSTPDEGTYKFKAQWGAKPKPLAWTVYSRDHADAVETGDGKEKFSAAIECWKRLPVGVTRWLGPRIRKHISL